MIYFLNKEYIDISIQELDKKDFQNLRIEFRSMFLETCSFSTLIWSAMTPFYIIIY